MEMRGILLFDLISSLFSRLSFDMYWHVSTVGWVGLGPVFLL
jgi:hypothetical protein